MSSLRTLETSLLNYLCLGPPYKKSLSCNENFSFGAAFCENFNIALVTVDRRMPPVLIYFFKPENIAANAMQKADILFHMIRDQLKMPERHENLIRLC
jgi:hypothetical protein